MVLIVQNSILHTFLHSLHDLFGFISVLFSISRASKDFIANKYKSRIFENKGITNKNIKSCCYIRCVFNTPMCCTCIMCLGLVRDWWAKSCLQSTGVNSYYIKTAHYRTLHTSLPTRMTFVFMQLCRVRGSIIYHKNLE